MKVVLRVANVAVRAALLVIVAYVSFRRPWPGVGNLAVVIQAFPHRHRPASAVGTCGLSASTRLPYACLLPYALGVVTVTCSMAAATPTGGELEVLAFIAAMMAGSDTAWPPG